MKDTGSSTGESPKFFVTPLGDGKYSVFWEEDGWFYEAHITDKWEIELTNKVKNPYPNDKFPMVMIKYEE